jgi:hypothetical protein
MSSRTDMCTSDDDITVSDCVAVLGGVALERLKVVEVDC